MSKPKEVYVWVARDSDQRSNTCNLFFNKPKKKESIAGWDWSITNMIYLNTVIPNKFGIKLGQCKKFKLIEWSDI